jgi:tetratricopeptide (TPR) repeat protein
MIVITPVLLVSLWRMQKWTWAMTWGCLFFLWHLLPVLQLLPVGEAILADRYSYIAGIGLSIVIFSFAEKLITKQTIKVLLFILWAGGLTYGAKIRTQVWKDSLTLWNNMIHQYPDGYFVAYNNRAIALQKLGRTNEALQDYTRAISMFEPYRDAWYNRGSLHADMQNHAAAVSDLSRAIQLDGNFKLAFYNRANSYASLGKMDSAQLDYERTLQLDPSYAEAWTNLGNVYGVKGMHKEAEYAFGKSIEYQPENAYAYNNRALARASQGKSEAAMLDFNMAIQIHQAAGNAMGMQEALANKRIYFPEP